MTPTAPARLPLPSLCAATPIHRFRFAGIFSALAACLVMAGSASAAAPSEKLIKSGLSIAVPPGVEVTTSELETGVEVIAVTRGEEVCLITVYPKRVGVARALDTHVDELSRHLKKTIVPKSLNIKPFKMRLFRRWRSARLIDYKTRVAGKDKRSQAHVIAGESRGRVIVVSWSAPRAGIARAFSPDLIRSLRAAKGSKSRKKGRKSRKR